MSLRKIALAAAAFALCAVPSVFAAPGHSMMAPMHGHTMQRHVTTGVYVCTKCHAYYTPSQARAMKYKDGMGHHLTHMAHAPKGYMMGGKMHKGTMHGNMKHSTM